jgi:hypothetical protein
MLQKQLDPALSAEPARAASDRSRGARIVATRISPDAAVLPVNTLRFYIYFSAPAEAVFERKHVRLLDDRASEVVEPFLIFSEELWSADGRRLTLLMEPSRIKRGMGNAPSHYPALVEERTYTLEGRTGGQVFAKTFSVSTGVATPLDETRWRVAEPRAGSRQPFLFNLTGSWTPRFARKRSRSSTWPAKRLLVQFRLRRALPNCGSRPLFHGLQRPIA